ncbi:MAG: LysR substrate-binding domain-containing protein, partial [Pseudomonadota bacterium]
VLARGQSTRIPLRVGALSTLSRNFQIQFLEPVLEREDVDLVLKSGTLDTLLAELSDLALDVVLTTEPPSGAPAQMRATKLAEQPVGLHGRPDLLTYPSLAALLSNVPVILPAEPAIRRHFDALIADLGVRPRIAAQVDDMAMVRLLAREGKGLALAPSVVFVDEIAAQRVVASPFDLAMTETFYAVTIKRNFPHPLLASLLAIGS